MLHIFVYVGLDLCVFGKMVKLYETVNVHLLIINAIMYFVAPIVAVQFSRNFSCNCLNVNISFISNLFHFVKLSRQNKTQRFSTQISSTKLFASNYASRSCGTFRFSVYAKYWLINFTRFSRSKINFKMNLNLWLWRVHRDKLLFCYHNWQ